jgi:hypothetical protein
MVGDQLKVPMEEAKRLNKEAEEYEDDDEGAVLLLALDVEQGLAMVEAAKREERREELRENALFTIVMAQSGTMCTIILD